MSLAATASRRHFLKHPGQLALGILGLALGVAVLVSIHATRESARAAFDLSAAQLAGDATDRVVAEGGVPIAAWTALKTQGNVARAAPVIEARVELLPAGANPTDRDGWLRVSLLGVDPVAEQALRPGFGASVAADAGGTVAGEGATEALDTLALMASPTAVLPTPLAARLGLAAGDALTLRHGGRTHALRVLALAPPASEGADGWLPGGYVLTDIATAGELTGAGPRLSRIDLALPSLPKAAAEARRAALQALLPDGARLVPAADAGLDVGQLTGAFYTNLTALGLLALLVGMFLVHATQSFLVTQRRELFGMLRALGVSRGGIARIVLGEALLTGLVGAVLGIALGFGLARLLLGAVALTLNDHYFSVAVNALRVPPTLVAAGLALGVGASLLASAAALAQAGGTPALNLSRMALERRSQRGARRAVLPGLTLMTMTFPLLAVGGRSLLAGFAALFLFALGAALVTPQALLGLTGLLRRWLAEHLPFGPAHALKLARGAVSRTGVACAALMLAAATGIGVSTMVASFRLSVEDWLVQLLAADAYLSLDGADVRLGARAFDDAALPALAATDAIAEVSAVRRDEVRFSGGATQTPVTVALAAYATPRTAFDGFAFLAGDPDEVFARWQHDDIVIVSEPFAWHHEVALGDSVTLWPAGRPMPFTVAGIYRDYGSEQGTLALSLATLRRHADAPGVDGIGLFAADGFDDAALEAAARAVLPDELSYAFLATRGIRERSLVIFDRTFVVTGVLRNLALVIACAGMFSSLLALGLERGRMLATYRALGTGRASLFAVTLLESGVVGLAAALVAVPVGLGLAVGLIDVINVRSFGWSMALTVPLAGVLKVVVAATLAALAAGLFPAWQASRVPLAGALRQD